jgi:hypothetical protein
MFYYVFRFVLAIANLLFGVAVVATANEAAEDRGGVRNKHYDVFAGIVTAMAIGNLAVIIRSMVT